MKRYILIQLLFSLTTQFTNKQVVAQNIIRDYEIAIVDTAVYPLVIELAKEVSGRHSKTKILNRETLVFLTDINTLGDTISFNWVSLYAFGRERSMKTAQLVVLKKFVPTLFGHFALVNLMAGDYALVYGTQRKVVYTFQLVGRPRKSLFKWDEKGIHKEIIRAKDNFKKGQQRP